MARRRRRRRSSNPNVAGQIALGTASVMMPLLPWILVAGGAWYLYQRFLASTVKQGATDVSNAVKGIAEGVGIATDPSKWEPTYHAAEADWRAAGGEGSVMAQPYYGPAGQWSGNVDS